MTPESGPWTVEAIGTVRSPRTEVSDDDWGNVRCRIVLHAPFAASSVRGLTEFSHLEVLFVFDRVDPASVNIGGRRPRGNASWPEVGIFAQRAKDRPNRIGVSTCEILAVDDVTIHVRGLDAIDGTPVLDVKPYFEEFGPRSVVRQPEWSRELMAEYF